MNTQVLVVEDDLEINELVGEYLALENLTYLRATTGQEGLDLAQSQHPDAIILDLMLPDITGYTIAKTLTSQRPTYDIPIIILSCLCDKAKGFAAGASFYMTKPFLPDDLLVTLRKALQWKAALHSRTPAGSITLGGGGGDSAESSLATNQMTADLFAHTKLTDAAIADHRAAVDLLATWNSRWNTTHIPRKLRLDYRILDPKRPTSSTQSATDQIEWLLSEDAPGLLADAFFKPAPPPPNGNPLGPLMTNPLSWGSSPAPLPTNTLLPPPAHWLQILLKTGASKFELDRKSRTIRLLGGTYPSPLTPNTTPLPVEDRALPTQPTTTPPQQPAESLLTPRT